MLGHIIGYSIGYTLGLLIAYAIICRMCRTKTLKD